MNEPLPSNRKFGLLFFVVFGLAAGYAWWRGAASFPVFVALSVAFLVVSLVAPGVLRPLNRAWMAFALLLHKVTSPIILGVMFFGLFAPWACLPAPARPLARFDRGRSYWIPVPPGPAGETRNQSLGASGFASMREHCGILTELGSS
jgi:hypothetical protein